MIKTDWWLSKGQALGPVVRRSWTEPAVSGTLLTYFQNKFSNKCKTLKGLFGISDKEFALPLLGILKDWTQAGIYFRNPQESYVSGDKREAFAEVQDNFTFNYSLGYAVT